MMKNDMIRMWKPIMATINDSASESFLIFQYCHVQNAPIIPNALDPYLKYHGVPSSGKFA